MQRKRFWFLGLIVATAIALIAASQVLTGLPNARVQAQTPAPSPTASPSPEASPSPSPAVSPSPDPTASPSPAVSPSPDPTASPSPSPTVSPSPSPTPVVQPSPTLQSPSLPLNEEPYQDPGDRFQIAILQDYEQTSVSSVPLFESPDGQLAYTVAVRPRASDDFQLNEAALAQVAIDTFSRGEAMLPGGFEPELTGGAKIPWTGSLTQGRDTQVMQGLMLSRQVPGRVLVLMVAATAEAADQLEPVYTSLAPTLQPILATNTTGETP